jgi:dephospho-CoA kinase
MEVGWKGRPGLLVRAPYYITAHLCMNTTFSSSAEIQLQRLMKRDGSSREDAISRLNSQLPITEKVDFADEIIENSGSLQDLDHHVDEFVQKLEREAGWLWRISWLIPPLGFLSALRTIAWRALGKSRSGRRRKDE